MAIKLKWKKDEDGDYVAKWGPITVSVIRDKPRGWYAWFDLDTDICTIGGGAGKRCKYRTIKAAQAAAEDALNQFLDEIKKAGG